MQHTHAEDSHAVSGSQVSMDKLVLSKICHSKTYLMTHLQQQLPDRKHLQTLYQPVCLMVDDVNTKLAMWTMIIAKAYIVSEIWLPVSPVSSGARGKSKNHNSSFLL